MLKLKCRIGASWNGSWWNDIAPSFRYLVLFRTVTLRLYYWNHGQGIELDCEGRSEQGQNLHPFLDVIIKEWNEFIFEEKSLHTRMLGLIWDVNHSPGSSNSRGWSTSGLVAFKTVQVRWPLWSQNGRSVFVQKPVPDDCIDSSLLLNFTSSLKKEFGYTFIPCLWWSLSPIFKTLKLIWSCVFLSTCHFVNPQK